MVQISFAKAFRRHVECPDATLSGTTVRDVMDAYFAEHPTVRGYVLDESGAVRKHVAIFHNEDLVVDRVALDDAVADGDRLQVFQALSGGCV